LTLKGEVDRIKSLETSYKSAVREAEILRQFHDNAELLKEQISDLQSKLQRAEQWQTKYLALQAEHEAYVTSEKSKWAAMGNVDAKFETPSQMCAAIEELKKEKVVLLDKQGALTAEISRLKVAVENSELMVSEIRSL
jgi:hypothetical protein